jgi:choline dehydrogenase-like flavoprotein
MARLQLVAGAREVYSSHSEPVVMKSEADLAKLDDAPWEPLRLRVMTAHQMGGCAMGGDPKQSVVDRSFRYRGLDNLFITDGSVFPTSLGVNPQLTIYSVAREGSRSVLASL